MEFGEHLKGCFSPTSIKLWTVRDFREHLKKDSLYLHLFIDCDNFGEYPKGFPSPTSMNCESAQSASMDYDRVWRASQKLPFPNIYLPMDFEKTQGASKRLLFTSYI